MRNSVVVGGLPESGKTTFLAAFWHLVTERDIETVLQFHNLETGSQAYLNEIAAVWREARVQERTAVTGGEVVTMNLLASDGVSPLRLTVPDLPGEEFQQMWEDRICNNSVASNLSAGGLIFFIHSDTIRAPSWVVDEVALSKQLGLPIAQDQEVPWHARLSPTQVQVIGLLQLLREPPLDRGARKLAIVLSAWDKGQGEGLDPDEYLRTKLPMLHQYLTRNADGWDWRAYGLSAQGGDYDPSDRDKPKTPGAEALREMPSPSMRIRLVRGKVETHDLTEPVAWLTE